MRRLLVLLALAALTGCSSGDDPAPAKPRPADDRAAIDKTVDRYYEGVADGDAAAVCATLTADVQRDLLAEEGAPCPEAIAPKLRPSADAKRDLRSVRVQDATIEGDRATATLTSDVRLASLPTPLQVQLQRVGGGWRISRRPPNPPPPGVAERCVEGGLNGFDKGEVHPFWQREGREALALYLSRLCYVGERRGLVDAKRGFDSTPRGKRELAKLSRDIVGELVAEGRIRDPDGVPQPDRIVG